MKLNKDLSQGSANSNVSTFHPFKPTAIAPTFVIEHLEVWGLGHQPDLKAEMEKTRPRKPNWNITSEGNVDEEEILSGLITQFES